MKKYLIIILCSLIGFFIYLQVPKQEKISPPSKSPEPEISISIEETDQYGLEYEDVEKILMPFIELGYMDIRINDFRWKYYCTGCCQPPHNEDKESLLLKRRNVDFSKSAEMPTPQEQYDVRAINKWCEKQNGKYAVVMFGNEVKFNVIEEVSKILFQNKVPYFLSRASTEMNKTDIELSLYQCHQSQRAETKLSEEEAIRMAIPSINADFPGTSTNEFDYFADYKLGVWTVYPYFLGSLPSAEISDNDGLVIRTLLKE